MIETENAPPPSATAAPVAGPKTVFALFLIGGILLRLLAINQPLLDAHFVRQAQTADWTQHASLEPGWPLSAEVSWRGDARARLTLEFPIYSYVVMALWRVMGHLDMAGKLVSITLWGLSFFVLQKIWQRLLTPGQTFWANILFALAPLSVFFGQAFMPEMAVQLLAFIFLHQLLLFQESGKRIHYFWFALAGLAGLLVKSLEVSHLYLVAAAVFLRKDGLRILGRPEHWIAGGITALCYWLWTNYVNEVNQTFFPAWTASALSKSFLGHWQQRLDWHFYFKVAAYLTAFLAGPIGALVALAGFFRRTPANHFGFWWLYSLVFFYLAWGPSTAGLHSYYNLPALGPVCFLFGLGMPAVLDWLRKRLRNPRAAAPIGPVSPGGGVGGFFPRALVFLTILPLLCGSLYLFRQDRTILEAALWIKEHSKEDDLVFVRINHRRDNNDYPEYPVFSYYAKRRSWIDTTHLTQAERERALAASTWAVMTRPPQSSSWAEKIRDKISRYVPLKEIKDWPKPGSDFSPVLESDKFVILRKTSNQ